MNLKNINYHIQVPAGTDKPAQSDASCHRVVHKHGYLLVLSVINKFENTCDRQQSVNGARQRHGYYRPVPKTDAYALSHSLTIDKLHDIILQLWYVRFQNTISEKVLFC